MRRRRFGTRRFGRRRAKWDMQTFRLCEQQLDFGSDNRFDANCQAPNINATKILGVSGSELQGSLPALLFGGGHLRARVNTAIIDHNDCPCNHSVKMVHAIVKLPLLEDMLTPAYLPNLLVSRTFDSVVASTQADTDEDILWWHDFQVDLANVSCSSAGGPCLTSGTDCSTSASDEFGMFNMMRALLPSLYGRHEVDKRIAVRRKIREREALFFITEWAASLPDNFNDCPGWPFHLNVYLRYAVRPSR